MTTTQKIQAVLATGELGLPAGMKPPGLDKGASGYNCWELLGDSGASYFDVEHRYVYHLIACEWAREIWSEAKSERRQNMSGTALERFDDAMADGDSEAAISAIHAALCREESDDT